MNASAIFSSSARENLFAMLRNAAPAEKPAQSPVLDKSGAGTAVDDSPAAKIVLSDRAKALLKRNRVEQAVADRLDRRPATEIGEENSYLAPQTDPNNILLAGFDIAGRGKPQETKTTEWEPGTKWGDASISDAEFTQRYKESILYQVEAFGGIEKRRALETAMADGTVKYHKGTDVPGLNMDTTTHYTTGSGGGRGMFNDISFNPTDEIKNAYQNGDAAVLWTKDRGNVFVTW